jgi:Mg-chelatase subunit ChlD
MAIRAGCALLSGLLLLACGPQGTGSDGKRQVGPVRPAKTEEGVALAIVFDTSGSMSESVSTGRGGIAAKVRIASDALVAIADRIEEWRSEAPGDPHRKIAMAVVTFREGEWLPMAPFSAEELKAWVKRLRRPDGPTPLGAALRDAGTAVLSSPLASKHILVITDGENTVPPEPAEVMDSLLALAGSFETEVSVHFVAFDVDAAVFTAVKERGATVVSASDAEQLNQKLSLILEEEILLEK